MLGSVRKQEISAIISGVSTDLTALVTLSIQKLVARQFSNF